jgi:Rieske Fe-S protein
MDAPDAQADSVGAGTPRRSFLARAASGVMLLGLALGYGAFAAIIGRFLYPRRTAGGNWQFVADLASIAVGQSLSYQSPAGQQVAITRLGETGDATDFIALSSVCPHLGCQVHWEGHNNRFFCPCHNGAFDSRGTATAGPPYDAGQSLSQYPLKVENGLLFIDSPTEQLA